MPAVGAGPALSTHSRLRFAALCLLYFAQGVPYGFVTIALVAVMAERGATPQQTGGLVALSLLPWTFKIFWGPIIDSYRWPSLGRRRPWIIFSQVMMAATMLGAFGAGDVTAASTVALLGAVFFVHNCFVSLQDVATDALAMDLLGDHERGRANAFMWASKLLGVSAGGAGTASLIKATNLQTAMCAQAVLFLAIVLLPLLVRERPGERLFPWSADRHAQLRPLAPVTGPWRVVTQLVRAFSLRTTLLGLIMAYFTFIGEGLSIPTNSDVFVNHIGWSAEHYAHMQAIWGTTGKLLGAIGGGLLCDRFGARAIAGLGAAITSLTFLTFSLTSAWWLADKYPRGLYFLCLDCGLAMTSVSLFCLFMSIAWTTAAATQFTLYMTVLNLGNASGPTLTNLGMNQPRTYLVCAAVSFLPLLFLPWIEPASVRRRLEADESEAPSAAAMTCPGGHAPPVISTSTAAD